MSKKNISSKDRDLFRQSIGKVSPVKSDKLRLNPTSKPKPFPKKTALDIEQKLIHGNESETESLGLGDTVSYLAPGLQKNIIKKLRRGYFGFDAELDLHGLSSNAAKYQLLRFLHSCIEDGLRCVHIIHGKGYRSPDNKPILKNDLNIWLRQHRDVLAFCSAAPKHGGSGAVIVLLRLSDKYGEQYNTQE